MIWMDRRATEEASWLESRIGNGCQIRIDPSYIIPKVLFIKKNFPEVYRNSKHFLQANASINYRLCQQASTDLSQEDPLQIYIGNGNQFASVDDFYDDIGVDRIKMPPRMPSSEVIGEVAQEASRETGLRKGTPVVAGAMDTSATALGMNVIDPGQTFHVAGQAGAIGVCSSEPIFDRRVCIHNHVIPGRWLIAGVMVATGASMRWLRNLLDDRGHGQSRAFGPDGFLSMSEEAAEVPVGSRGLVFIPYMMGERTPIWDFQARGILFGLSLATGRGELARAIMEGSSYALRDNIEVLESLGLRIDRVVCGGGAIKSSLWNQIKADITKRTLTAIGGDVCAPLGAAMLAAKGIGKPIDFEQTNVKPLSSYQPNLANYPVYDCLYGVYKRLYENVKQEYKKIALVDSSISAESGREL